MKKTDDKGGRKGEDERKADAASKDEMTAQLLIAADRLQVAGVVALCSSKLAESVKIENVADMLMPAETLQTKDLKVWLLALVLF